MLAVRTREHRRPLALTRTAIPPSPLRDRVSYSDHDRFRGYVPVHWHSGLQPPCLRFAAAVTGRHARLGSRLLARLCRGHHLRRQTSTRLQGATRTDPGVRCGLLPRVRRRPARGLKPDALRRTAANRIDVVSRLSVRTTAACRLFPSGEALPSTTSAGSCLPLFGASSVLRPHPTSHPRACSACGICLPEPARHEAGHG